MDDPADMFLVSRSLYLGIWPHKRDDGEFTRPFKEKFIHHAFHFVKPEGIFITERPLLNPEEEGYDPAPKPLGFKEIIKMGQRTGVYLRAVDQAQAADNFRHDLGGIDLRSSKVNLQTKIAGNSNDSGIQFHIDPAMLAQLKEVPGFVPLIINIRPLTNLKQFLGVE